MTYSSGDPYQSALEELATALDSWDYSPVYPADYPATSGVIVLDDYPYQIISQLSQLAGDTLPAGEAPNQLAEYLISIKAGSSPDEPTRLGQLYGPGASGKTRYGVQVRPHFIISCWADQRLGGMDAARKLGGQVMGCLLVNKNALTSYRHLKVAATAEGQMEAAQLYFFSLSVEGDLVVSFDQ